MKDEDILKRFIAVYQDSADIHRSLGDIHGSLADIHNTLGRIWIWLSVQIVINLAFFLYLSL